MFKNRAERRALISDHSPMVKHNVESNPTERSIKNKKCSDISQNGDIINITAAEWNNKPYKTVK